MAGARKASQVGGVWDLDRNEKEMENGRIKRMGIIGVKEDSDGREIKGIEVTKAKKRCPERHCSHDVHCLVQRAPTHDCFLLATHTHTHTHTHTSQLGVFDLADTREASEAASD